VPGIADLIKNVSDLKLDESKKKIFYLYVLGIVVLFLVYIFLFLKPSITNLAGLIPVIRERTADIKAVQEDLPFIDKFRLKHRSQEEDLKKFEKKLSREIELPLLLESLSKIARKSRVKILGITPLDSSLIRQKRGSEKSKIYEEVPILITAQSGYHELGAFTSKLESDERFLQISNLKIQANRSDSKRHSIEFVVYAFTFKSE